MYKDRQANQFKKVCIYITIKCNNIYLLLIIRDALVGLILSKVIIITIIMLYIRQVNAYNEQILVGFLLLLYIHKHIYST